MFGLTSIMYGALFMLNALIILDERRFLSKIGLPLSPESRSSLNPGRKKLVDLLRAIRAVMMIPLILLNILCMIYEIFLG